MIITEATLLTSLDKENLYAFKVEADLDYTNFNLLRSASLDELIKISII